VDLAIGLALEVFGPPALAAGLVAAVIAGIGPRLLPARLDTLALPLSLALGFFAGYLCLSRTTTPLWPEQSWHWLPYVALAATAVGAPIAKSQTAIRIFAACALALLVGWLLTPSWPSFGLTWPTSIAWLSLYAAGSTIPLVILPERLLGRLLLAMLSISAAVLAVAIAAMVSIRLAQLAGIAAAGLAGCYVGTLRSGIPDSSTIRGLLPVFTTLICGTAFSSSVEPDPPLAWLLIVPQLPLFIWLKR
jgi:hypothetical protein